jgi:hypothetical protein
MSWNFSNRYFNDADVSQIKSHKKGTQVSHKKQLSQVSHKSVLSVNCTDVPHKSVYVTDQSQSGRDTNVLQMSGHKCVANECSKKISYHKWVQISHRLAINELIVIVRHKWVTNVSQKSHNAVRFSWIACLELFIYYWFLSCYFLSYEQTQR